MDKTTREKFITLCFSGGDVDLAYLHNAEYTLDEYETAFTSDEYQVFADEVQNRFLAGADLRIVGNLYRAEAALKEVGPEHKNYPAILKTYKELFQLSSPIVERMQKIRVESNAFENLELCIKGATKDEEG